MNGYAKIPGVGYFYGGISQRKSQLTVLIASASSLAIVSFQVSVCREKNSALIKEEFKFFYS